LINFVGSKIFRRCPGGYVAFNFRYGHPQGAGAADFSGKCWRTVGMSACLLDLFEDPQKFRKAQSTDR
jgi:hypothetical protein